MASAAGIVDFARSRFFEKLPEHFNQVMAVDIVPHLFPFVAKDAVGMAGNRAAHEVSEKSV